MIVKTLDGEIIDFTRIVTLIGQWVEAELAVLMRQWPVRREGLLMGCPIWGESYIDRFDRYCLPSMLAGENGKALRGTTRMVLFTDHDGMAPLSSLRNRLQGIIDVAVIRIPDAIMAEVPKYQVNSQWVLGACHQLALQMAGHMGMDFHGLCPDVVFSDGYFPNLKRLGKEHEGIAHTNITSTLDVLAELGTFPISDRDLGDLGWKHLHPQTRSRLMNDRNDLPRTTTFVYRGKSTVSFYSAHMNVAFLSARMCAKAPVRIPPTIDAELPIYMLDFYVPKASDGMTLIEFSGPEKVSNRGGLAFSECSEWFWNVLKFNDRYLPYVKARGEMPTRDSIGMELDEIEEQQGRLMDSLVADQAQAALRMKQRELAA